MLSSHPLLAELRAAADEAHLQLHDIERRLQG